MKHRPKHIAEYFFVRAVVGLLRILPCRLAMLTGCCVAWIGHRIVRYRVGSAKERIREIFPERFSESELSRIVWLSWRNFILTIVDMARVASVTTEWLTKHMANYESLAVAVRQCIADHKGAVFACPHIGSWEIGTAAIHLAGARMFVFATRQKNQLVDDYMTGMRNAAGVTCIRRGSSGLRSAIRKLKDGEMMGILPDVRIPTEGLQIRFLGRNANIGAGMAALARQAGVPLVPLTFMRTGLASFDVKVYPIVRSDPAVDRDDDIKRMTQDVFDMVSEVITAHPEQWFWFNKRWIFDPFIPSGGDMPLRE